MMHVKQIQEIVAKGQNSEAHAALDQLLSLGPQNTEALKLKAHLFEYEGRFVEEGRAWERIASVDNEDQDAIHYLLRRQMEDREHFYFTDEISGGGRRFMAYPRQLVNMSVTGLMGCVVFLLTTRLTLSYPILSQPYVILSLFSFLVILPWLAIVISYFRGLKAVTLTPGGVEVASRRKRWSYKWDELEKVCLARSSYADVTGLHLIFLPKDRSVKPLALDFNHATTTLRARSYLVREITKFFGEPDYTTRDALGLRRDHVINF